MHIPLFLTIPPRVSFASCISLTPRERGLQPLPVTQRPKGSASSRMAARYGGARMGSTLCVTGVLGAPKSLRKPRAS